MFQFLNYTFKLIKKPTEILRCTLMSKRSSASFTCGLLAWNACVGGWVEAETTNILVVFLSQRVRNTHTHVQKACCALHVMPPGYYIWNATKAHLLPGLHPRITEHVEVAQAYSLVI